eukprot:GHRR01037553.1.p1 GENE.GHRR01037553.1~~GHRR01037553.1.p1  ORF type:complete len:127 (+),score=42.75 GHRR01037553.1:133-513(+)
MDLAFVVSCCCHFSQVFHKLPTYTSSCNEGSVMSAGCMPHSILDNRMAGCCAAVAISRLLIMLATALKPLPAVAAAVKCQGQIVMELMRVLYTDPESYQLVYAFNHQPDKFNFGVLLQQLGISSSI